MEYRSKDNNNNNNRESDNLLRRQKESANVDGLIPDRVKIKIQERGITNINSGTRR